MTKGSPGPLLVKLDTSKFSGSLLLTRLCGVSLYWDFGCSLPRVRVFSGGSIWRAPEANRRAQGPSVLNKASGWGQQKTRVGTADWQEWVTVLCKWSYYYYYFIIIKGRFVPELPSMACDFCAAIISPGTGPGAPSQWCKKWDSPLTPTHLLPTKLHISQSSPAAQKWASGPRWQRWANAFHKSLALRRGGEIP